MKKYLCESAEIVTDPQGVKNPYVKLTFVDPQQDNNDPFAVLERKITIVISGGFFTADNQPDKARNYEWCKENAPKFKSAQTDLHEFSVQVEPYYLLGADGKPKGNPLTNIGITTFAKKDESGNIVPRFTTESGLQRNAANRLANGTTMYVTLAALQAEKAVERQIGGITEGVSDPFASASPIEESNPYA